MTLPPTASGQVDAALRAVTEAAQTAQDTSDLEAAKRALNAVWWAVHDATETLNRAERETRFQPTFNVEKAA